MHIQVDLTTVPPSVTLGDPDDFSRFSVRMRPVLDTWVDPELLRAVAGERGADPHWRAQLDGMLEYAGAKGWLDETGAVQAHVEWDPGLPEA